MSKTLLLSFAAAAAAFAQTVYSFEGGGTPGAAEPAQDDATPTETPKRGRPKGAIISAGEAKPAEPTTTGGKTYAENQALIKPLVEAQKGAEVQAIILKYSTTGLKDLPAQHQAAFEKDLQALMF